MRALSGEASTREKRGRCVVIFVLARFALNYKKAYYWISIRCNREKSLRHVAMVAKFLGHSLLVTTNRKREFAPFQTSSILLDFIFVKCWRTFLGLNSKGTAYLSLEKEKDNFFVVFTYFIRRGEGV